MAQTITDFVPNSLEAQTRMRERAISQDGKVTMLDLPKAHGIPYMEVFSLTLILISKPYG